MKFSFEVPIKYLEELDEEQDYLFILGHHLVNDKYYNYVKKSNKMKILDNGAYELVESIAPQKLLDLARDLSVDIVIVPDKIFDKKRSLELEEEFFNLLNDDDRRKFKFMKVVCGNSLKEYLESLLEVAHDDRINFIGLSQSRAMIGPNLSYLMNYIYDNAERPSAIFKPIHLLGMFHPFEIIEAKRWGQIKSIDTGRPINFALKNKEFPILDKWIEYKKESGVELDVDVELDIQLAKQNMRNLKQYDKTDY